MRIIGHWSRRPLKAIVAAAAHARPMPCPATPKRILVVRDGGYGDLILTVPIIRTLRRHFGDDLIVDALVCEPVADVYRGLGLIDQLFVKGSGINAAWAALRSMRQRRYTIVVDLVLSSSLSFALWILRAAPGAHRIGGDKAELRGMYHQHCDLPPRSSMNFLERLYRIGSQAFGDAPLADNLPWFHWPDDVREHVDSIWHELVGETPGTAAVFVNMSAGNPARTWPDEKYQELLSRLVPEFHDRVTHWIISAAPHERERATRLAASMSHPRVLTLPNVPDFRVVAALIGRMSMVITPDTSIVHSCSAHGTPAVVLTVADNVTTWAPWKVDYESVAAAPGWDVNTIACSDVHDRFTELFNRIYPDR